ncbi:MAG: murein biosynthesis integral membrane protein MurJ [Actinomycetota bacterium]|jgi:putative peptidoglycan lipid II flippase|nr:murein biosynthesis integral membrane protein MurJ [Actinomycetota bacterium]
MSGRGPVPEGPPDPDDRDPGIEHGSLTGATVGMAVGTAASRATGVLRVFALTTALGGTSFADAYNLANTTPNIVTDIVVGGVLAATFVPVFVDRLATRRAAEAWRAISAVTTATVMLLVVATVAFWFAAPAIISLYTVANHAPDVRQQQAMAVTLLRWFVPQLTCYGLIALFSALLNARRRFAAPMFVAIANNLVVIVVLLWFHAILPHPTLSSVAAHHSALVVLAFGTTLGVVAQTALLAPSLRRARLHVHFRFEPGHEAMRTIVRLAGWTFGIVAANQVALVVILALADGIPAPGSVSAYSYAYTFFQLPFGVVAVSVMSAVTPVLAERWAVGDVHGFRRRMAQGLRSMLAIIIPSAVGMLVLAHPLIQLVLAHGAESHAAAATVASTLAMFSLGLPGFCVFLYAVRVLQAMQDTRTAFLLYAVENGVNVVTGLALVGPLGVRGLALSLSLAYVVAGLASFAVLAARLHGIGADTLRGPLRRVTVATVAMAIVALVVVNLSAQSTTVALALRVGSAIGAGSLTYVGVAALLGARAEHRRHRNRSGSPPPAPHVPSGGAALTRVEPFRDRLDTGRPGPSVRVLRPPGEVPDARPPDRGDVETEE